MAEKSRKQALLDELIASRAEWDALITKLGRENLAIPGVAGNWSVKDIIAHITTWETRPVKWLEAAKRGDKPEPASWGQGGGTEEEINARIYELNRNLPLEQVIAESRHIHDAVVSAVREMSEEDVAEKKYEWLGNGTLADAIPGNSYEHYRLHADTIRSWFETRQMV